MLSGSNLPVEFSALLSSLRCCFTAPTFRTFVALATGFIAQPGTNTVTGMLTGARLSTVWHHSRAHGFFAYARWSPDALGLMLCQWIVEHLLEPEAPIHLIFDDTLFRRKGKKIFGAWWHHDPTSSSTKPVARGICFVVGCVVVHSPILDRPLCLPVMIKLWIPKTREHATESKIVMARRSTEAIATAYSDRKIQVTADSAYAGKDLRGLPDNVVWTTRLRANAALHDFAPPRTGRRGRPALKGKRLGSLTDLSGTLQWEQVEVTRYGKVATVEIATLRCLWYSVFHTQAVLVVMLRELEHDGYDVAFVTTDVKATPAEIVCRYAMRWSIEVTFFEAKEIIGVGETRNRVKAAVERSVPFGFFVMTLVNCWYLSAGHDDGIVQRRRKLAPWYRTKTHPSFLDMVVALRRDIIAGQFRQHAPDLAKDEEIIDLLMSWSDARVTCG
jgi:DDE superfamily endonuclease